MRIRSYIRLTLILVIAAAILVAGVLVIRFAVRGMNLGGGGNGAQVSDAFVQQPEAYDTPAPVETEEPAGAFMTDLPDVDLSQWSLQLVRIDKLLPENYEPELSEVEREELFDSRAAMHLTKLIEDARAAGYEVYLCSGYRSYETQNQIYWNHVEQYMREEGLTQEEAEARTRLSVNYPGASEHQLGLAADILEFQGQDMEPYIGGSGLMLWLEEHCAEYGFIIRYPDGKTDITGIEYEPWHLRYVGTCAGFIMEHGLCLEEFLALYQ